MNWPMGTVHWSPVTARRILEFCHRLSPFLVATESSRMPQYAPVCSAKCKLNFSRCHCTNVTCLAMQILIWLLTDDDPEVKKTSISHGINASRANDDLIFRICSYLSDWYRLQRAVCCLAVQICNPREQAALRCRRFETPWNRACPQYHDQTSTATRIFKWNWPFGGQSKCSEIEFVTTKLNPSIDEKGIMRVGGEQENIHALFLMNIRLQERQFIWWSPTNFVLWNEKHRKCP